MIDMAEIRSEIKKLECGPTTFSNCEKLAALYTICDHAKGLEMAEAYERRESAREKTEAKKADHHTMTLDMAMVDEWMDSLYNEDGTKGAHWSLEQIKQVMNQKGIKEEFLPFAAVMNSLYSDYCGVLKKHNVNNIDFYVDMTKAWLNDKDAVDGKAARYFEYITK